MKNLILALCLVLFSLSHIIAQDTVTIEDKVKELLSITEQKKNFDDAIDNMVDIQLQSDASVALLGKDFFTIMRTRIKEEGFDTLVKIQAEIYSRYFTVKELDAFIEFYKTPEGHSILQKMPLATQELMQASQAWGRSLGEEIATNLRLEKIEKFNLELKEDCSRFKNGNFYMFSSIDGEKITISRKGKNQVETKGSAVSKFKIKWLSNNRYIIQEAENKDDDGYIVNIYEVTENSYKYITAKDDSLFIAGEIFIAD